MGITNEQLKAENIAQISLLDLAKMTVELSAERDQIEDEKTKAFLADDIDLLLAHASSGGVVTVQIEIIGLEVQRREDAGLISDEENEELHNYTMQVMLGHLLGGVLGE